MFNKIIAVVSLLATVAQAVDHAVVVGANNSLTFQPNSITAAPQDTVTFQFVSKNHTITQSTFKDPCTQETGGFAAPFNQVVAPNATDFPTITIVINDTKPVWVYCAQTIGTNHCHAGMVMAINPTPNATLAEFQAAAIALGNSSASTNSTSSGNGSGGGSSGSGSNSSSSGGSPPNAAMQVQLTGVMGLLAAVGSAMLFL